MRTNLAALAILCVFCVLPVRAENWPDWRGPNHDGVSHETNLPTKWSETENIAWKLKMPGKAGSTPVIWGNTIFLTSVDGIEPKTEPKKKGMKKEAGNDPAPSELLLLAVSTDGKELWRRKLGKSNRGKIRYDEGNDASASPACDGTFVYCFFGSGDLAAYDFDGHEIWHRNIQKDYGSFSILHGVHQSPVVHGDRLYLALIHSNGHWLIALDKATGKEIWKQKRESDARGESREAYASPILWKNGDEMQIVVLGADYATGHRLTDGKEVWRLGELNPTAQSQRTPHHRVADSVDGGARRPNHAGGLIICLKPGVKGEVGPGNPFEMWRKQKGAPDVPTATIHGGLAYVPRENGVLQCWELKSGNELYAQRLERVNDDRFRASAVYGDGKVYVTARDGTCSVVEAGPKFKLLAVNNLPDTITASPAISGGTIYLRGFADLYAIRNR